ncbi:hypothetical protein P7L78_22055 [Tistrella bauzanensis]|uniref:hypothetical protein n=1 Tax=Tistrella TaxID=171436 RepID=UPI0031F6E352
MRVKIGDTWHDGGHEPVAVVLTHHDIHHILHAIDMQDQMRPDGLLYAAIPDGAFGDGEEADRWLAQE